MGLDKSNISEKKSDLRVQIKERLEKLSQHEITQKSNHVCGQLAKFLKSLNSDNIDMVGGYAPILEEVNWLPCLNELSLKTSYPDFRNGKMDFFQASFSSLEESRSFGPKILVPPKEAIKVTPSVLFVPGLGFDKLGYRLGRGKGFYDKYLENYKGLKIGLCFEEQLVDIVPREGHDQKLNCLITDLDIYNFEK